MLSIEEALDFKKARDDFTETNRSKLCKKVALPRTWNEREPGLAGSELVELSCAYAQARLVVLSVYDSNRTLHVPDHLIAWERSPISHVKGITQG